MKIIAENKLATQEKERPTTSQEILIELTKTMGVKPCVLVLHTKITRDQIRDINEGKQDPEVFAKLMCFWAMLKVNEEEDTELESKIHEKQMEYIFYPDYNDRTISNYADKHGV